VISRSLCEMMGGQLQLSSQPGIGTQVSVSLPLAILPPEVTSPKHEPQIQTALTPLNVLVVDDHPANRLLMCQQLEFLGHHFSIAEEGQSALEQWKNGAFDLVIADCNMPVMNGYELTRAIRHHETLLRRPTCTVLGFTANAQPEEILRCKQAGMNECLFKPLSLSALSQWVDSVQPVFHTPMMRTPAFNLQGLHTLTGGSPVQTRRLLIELLKSSRLDRQDLQALSPGRDHQALAEIAHKIKGAARIAQASRLIDSCNALEQACLQALPVDEIERRYNASSFAILELEKALEQQLTLTEQSRMTGP
jgi:two-component system sensor histidine kinase EvgS